LVLGLLADLRGTNRWSPDIRLHKVIELDCNEVQHLFAALVCRPAGDYAHRLRWSWWRNRQ
jgi:hypothetical protein